ncbi:hypothetical protein [Nocardia asteroides]|uniref:hypothetical protein n=1 Tax=Nocardia asteroides TaxID=1824 RepID=UPI001E2B86C8|nr:hypothetical protein [Nocardia asteroides]UGT52798.1 hypothetical protein LTT85_18980 [Nocardia asteroides]
MGQAPTPPPGFGQPLQSAPGFPPRPPEVGTRSFDGFAAARSGPQVGPPPAAQQAANPPGITVDSSYLWTAFMLSLVKPKIFVNGQPVPTARWGQTHVPVGPGQYHVRVVTPWLFDMGPAEIQVPVNPGAGTKVYYKPPAAMFLKGAIGPEPQQTPGLVFVWLPFVAVAVLFVLFALLLISM